MTLRIAILSLWVFCAMQLAPQLAHGQSHKWEKLKTERGVTVFTKHVDGQGLPVLKGITTIDASVFEVLAVLNDTPRNKEWMANCSESRLIKLLNPLERIVYTKTDAPWPISDRDAVVHSQLRYDEAKGVVLIKFWSEKNALQPSVPGVVRVPKLVGHYRIRIISEHRVRVEYQINADPGGMLPQWLVEMTSEQLPIVTLANMRRQIKKTRGRYDQVISGWDPAKGGKLPAPLPD